MHETTRYESRVRGLRFSNTFPHTVPQLIKIGESLTKSRRSPVLPRPPKGYSPLRPLALTYAQKPGFFDRIRAFLLTESLNHQGWVNAYVALVSAQVLPPMTHCNVFITNDLQSSFILMHFDSGFLLHADKLYIGPQFYRPFSLLHPDGPKFSRR